MNWLLPRLVTRVLAMLAGGLAGFLLGRPAEAPVVSVLIGAAVADGACWAKAVTDANSSADAAATGRRACFIAAYFMVPPYAGRCRRLSYFHQANAILG